MKSMKIKVSIIFVFAFIIGFFVVQTFILQSKGQRHSVAQKMPPADVAVEKPQISPQIDEAARHDKKAKIVSASSEEHLEILLEDNGFFKPEETTFLEAIFSKKSSQRTYRIVLCDFDGVLFPIGKRNHRFFNQSLSPIFKRLVAAGVLLGGLPMEGEKEIEDYVSAFNTEFGGFNFFLDINDHFSQENPRLLLRGGVVSYIQASRSTKGRALRDLLVFLRDVKGIKLKMVKLVFVDDKPDNLNSVIDETFDLGLGQLVPVHYVNPFEAKNVLELANNPIILKELLNSLYRNLLRFWFPEYQKRLP